MRAKTAKKLNHIPLTFFFALVFIVGVVFLVLSLSFKQEIPENYATVEATIEKIDEYQDPFMDNEWKYDVYINYSYPDNSHTYTDKSYGQYDSSMKVGDKVTIYVNPTDPEEFMTDGSGDFIFPLLSGIFAVIGIVGVVYNVKKLVELKRREN